MAADVKLLKAALEDAKFDDPVVREKIYKCINALAQELEELNYSSSLDTDRVFDDLESYLDEDVVEEEVEEEDVEEEEEDVLDDDDDDNDPDEITIGDDEDEEEDK